MRLRAKLVGALLLASLLAGAVLFAWQPWTRRAALTPPGDSGVRVHEAGLIANYFPATDPNRPGPGVVVLGGSEGGLGGGAARLARALNASGFSVIQVAYFGAPGQPSQLELVPLEPVFQAIDWIGARPEVDPERIAIFGISKGAEAALLVATHRLDLRAIVLGAPSSVVWPGIGFRFAAGARSSWVVCRADLFLTL